MMKIDKKDLKRLVEKGIPVNKKKITDLQKYTYWSNKSEEYTDKMVESKDNKHKYIENYRNGLLAEMEKNRYCQISKKELITLILLLKHHNNINKDNKIYMNDKGIRVNKDDRRAIGDTTI